MEGGACWVILDLTLQSRSGAKQAPCRACVRAGRAGCAGNSKHIQTLISLATLLLASLGRADGQHAPARLQTVNGFLFSAGLDNMNLFRLMRFAFCWHKEFL